MPVNKPASIVTGYNNRIEVLEGVLKQKGVPQHMFHPLRRSIATLVTGQTTLVDYEQQCLIACDGYLRVQVDEAVKHEQKRQEIMNAPSDVDAHFGPRPVPTTISIKDWLALPEAERPDVTYNFNKVERIYRDPTYNDTDHYVIGMRDGGAGSKRGSDELTLVDHLKRTMIWWTGLYNKHQVKTLGGPDLSVLRHQIAGVPTMKDYTAHDCRTFQENAIHYLNTHYPIGGPVMAAETTSAPPTITNDDWKAWAAPWKAKGYTSQELVDILVTYAGETGPAISGLPEWPFDLPTADNVLSVHQKARAASPSAHKLSPAEIRAKYTIQMKRYDKKKGKDVFTDYLQVPGRVLLLRIDHPDWGIDTELLQINETGATMKAMVRNEAGVLLATGHAYVTTAGSDKFSGRIVEKAETSAIGRALAHAGYGTDEAELDFEE